MGGLTSVSLPVGLDRALERALQLIGDASRSVMIVTGDTATTNLLMMEAVRRSPGGLDDFGPGKRCEALLKERSAPWGALWESCLLIKALAKRQVSTIRFGKVVVLPAECTAAAADRVYRHCFSDWRVLVDGGAANGGRDDPMAILVETVPGASANGTEGTAVEADDALLARSATYDDRWYEDGLVVHCHHPSWPQTSVLPSGRREY